MGIYMRARVCLLLLRLDSYMEDVLGAHTDMCEESCPYERHDSCKCVTWLTIWVENCEAHF